MGPSEAMQSRIKADSVKRLEQERDCEVFSPESQGDTEFNAILPTLPEIGNKKRWKMPKMHLDRHCRGELFVGNRCGHSLAGLPNRVYDRVQKGTTLKSRPPYSRTV